jgi:hypothetical protein
MIFMLKYTCILLFLIQNFIAQTLDSIQVIRSFQIGAGKIINTLSLQQNNNDLEYITGWDFNANYLFHNLTRIEFKYCTFDKLDILPYWKNVHLQNINFNYHHIISNQDGTFFIYPTIGLSYSIFSAFQVIDKNFSTINQNKTFAQIGGNAGLGAEVHIKFFSIFVDYNMRVTKITDNTPVGLRNVGFSAGLRIFYFQMHWHKDEYFKKKNHLKKRKRRKLFDILHDRYHWF